MKRYCKGGSPSPPATATVPDPAADAKAKEAAAEAKSREKRRHQQGAMNGTLATSPEGVLGAAPTNSPSLKPILG